MVKKNEIVLHYPYSEALLAELGSLMGMFVIGYWVLGNFTFIRSGTFNNHICDWEMGETSMLTFK